MCERHRSRNISKDFPALILPRVDTHGRKCRRPKNSRHLPLRFRLLRPNVRASRPDLLRQIRVREVRACASNPRGGACIGLPADPAYPLIQPRPANRFAAIGRAQQSAIFDCPSSPVRKDTFRIGGFRMWRHRCRNRFDRLRVERS